MHAITLSSFNLLASYKLIIWKSPNCGMKPTLWITDSPTFVEKTVKFPSNCVCVQSPDTVHQHALEDYRGFGGRFLPPPPPPPLEIPI